jgi:hypothetical protein
MIDVVVVHPACLLCALCACQADHFESFFYPSMTERGYEGLYKQKTREPMGVEGACGRRVCSTLRGPQDVLGSPSSCAVRRSCSQWHERVAPC